MCFSSACQDEDFVSVMRASRPLRADVCVVPRLYELGMAVPRGCLDEIWGIPLIPLRRSGQSSAALALKRIFDLVAAAVLLALAAPLMLLLAIAVRLRTGQAALFRQARVTGDGRTAQIAKLRTLTAHDDHDTRWTPAEQAARSAGGCARPTWTSCPSWSTCCGARCRWWVRGRNGRTSPSGSATRFPVTGTGPGCRPGMTGWAQVNGLNGDTSIFERARFDNYYVEYWSLWLDLVILARTAGRRGPRHPVGGRRS